MPLKVSSVSVHRGFVHIAFISNETFSKRKNCYSIGNTWLWFVVSRVFLLPILCLHIIRPNSPNDFVFHQCTTYLVFDCPWPGPKFCPQRKAQWAIIIVTIAKQQKKAERKDSHNALNQRTREHNLMGSAVPKLAIQQNAVPWRRLPGLRTYNGAAVAALRKLHILQKITLSVSNFPLKNSLIKQSYFQLVRKSSHRFACNLAGTTSSFLITQPRITRSRL